MNRRELLKIISLTPLAFSISSFSLFAFMKSENESEKRFSEIIAKAYENSWDTLPIGKLMSLIGIEFLGTPYIAGTLDEGNMEVCVVDLMRLDCVTFVEIVLDIARILKKNKREFSDLKNEITLTRYRSGRLTDYTSRLHYTSDWILDNEKKGVVREISNQYRGSKFEFTASFMSDNPNKYKVLKENPGFITVIKKCEDYINSKNYSYIPKERILGIENYIFTGDIIAITTNIKGLDYSHLGLAYREENSGDLKFMHASSNQKRVQIEPNLIEYLKNIKKDTGISIVRPLEL